MARVSLVNCGCPKNWVDMEVVLAEIISAGHDIAVDDRIAEVIVVNTCGYIENALLESMEAIHNAISHKTKGTCKAVIVFGCMPQRYDGGLPEFGFEKHGGNGRVDAVLGIEPAAEIVKAIERVLSGGRYTRVRKPRSVWVEPRMRMVATPPWTAYLKISEGCSNRCAYCMIPDIRGPFRSRPEEMILSEAGNLARTGVQEIVLIGQDLTQYGEDIDSPNRLADLLYKLNEIDGLRWIRLMYCYPSRVTDELIKAVAECDKVVKYIDIPLQHADNDVLRAMNRKGSVEQYAKVIEALRGQMPDVALRTTFIVGFPGESEAAFENLLSFVERIRFDRVGAFVYSREPGTPAARLRPVAAEVADQRYDRLMQLQQGISLDRNRSFVGKKLDILIEGRAQDGVYGRSYRDAPDIDGLVYLPGKSTTPGSFVNATVVDATEYDLSAK